MIGLVAAAAPVHGQTEIPKTRRQSDPIVETIPNTPQPSLGAATEPRDRQAHPAPNTPAPSQVKATATGLHLAVSDLSTGVAVSLSHPVTAHVFSLSNPYRVVIDIPNVNFELPASLSRQSGGLVRAVRFGLIAPGKSRIVVELTKPALVSHNAGKLRSDGGVTKLFLTLTETSAEDFAAALMREPPQPPSRPEPPEMQEQIVSTPGKPVVMIDPGHGGIDGGATGPGNALEKDIVLAVALQLKSSLQASQRYDVRMTRKDDSFISLDQRVEKSKQAGANLFISIHADAVADIALAQTAHGATVYTLSETASHRAAQRLADKENAADATAGFAVTAAGDAQIDTILGDLLARETQNYSLKFRSLVTSRLASQQLLARDPARAAAFKVLRQPQTPSVLIELGFMTNTEEARLMQTSAWQARVSRALAAAVDKYFANRSAQAP